MEAVEKGLRVVVRQTGSLIRLAQDLVPILERAGEHCDYLMEAGTR